MERVQTKSAPCRRACAPAGAAARAPRRPGGAPGAGTGAQRGGASVRTARASTTSERASYERTARASVSSSVPQPGPLKFERTAARKTPLTRLWREAASNNATRCTADNTLFRVRVHKAQQTAINAAQDGRPPRRHRSEGEAFLRRNTSSCLRSRLLLYLVLL